MKVKCSLKSAKARDKDCKLVRRKGRVYVINKKNPRMKARQGQFNSAINFSASNAAIQPIPAAVTACL